MLFLILRVLRNLLEAVLVFRKTIQFRKTPKLKLSSTKLYPEIWTLK